MFGDISNTHNLGFRLNDFNGFFCCFFLLSNTITVLILISSASLTHVVSHSSKTNQCIVYQIHKACIQFTSHTEIH